MTIHAKQPSQLAVVSNKTVRVHLANSPENHRKYHCSYSDMLEWRLCVKSDWLSVVKSCCFCLLLAWICWLHWSNYQLSLDISELKNTFSFDSRISEYPIGKESPFSEVENIQQPILKDFGVKHSVYKHSARNKQRKRRQRDGKIVEAIKDYMKKNTYVLFLPGTNEKTERGYFKWNLTYTGSEDEFITSNSNGTFTFKRKGFYLVASQLTVKGINNQQNYAISYGYKTVLVKGNDDEVLMLSEITQDNRGISYTESQQHCAIDSISHMVMRYFEREDKIAIKAYTNSYNVNYYLTEKNSYIGIVALDLWNN